jgi:hypothetical protein
VGKKPSADVGRLADIDHPPVVSCAAPDNINSRTGLEFSRIVICVSNFRKVLPVLALKYVG